MSDDDVTAYHEAGHAVMGVYLGGQVKRVCLAPESSVDQNEDFPSYGDTVIAWPVSPFTDQQHAEREIRTALAGPVCEMIYSGNDVEVLTHAETAADWHIATDRVKSMIAEPEKQVAYLSRTLIELVEFFKDDSLWAAVSALADELQVHDELESDMIHATVGFWLRRR
jgi:hypothetical protein